VRVPSDEALQLLDFMVEVGASGVGGAATFQQLLEALDIRTADDLHNLLGELVEHDYVRRKLPAAITGRTTYYVNRPQFERLLKALDPDADKPAEPRPEPDWSAIKAGIEKLAKIVDEADLSQSQKAQAGAITSTLKILLEAPDPPSKAIKELLYALAAIATIFALALEVASKL
jgi:hypothetical protein